MDEKENGRGIRAHDERERAILKCSDDVKMADERSLVSLHSEEVTMEDKTLVKPKFSGRRIRRIAFLVVAVVAAFVTSVVPAPGHAQGAAAPIYVAKIPPGYRDWRLISVAREEGTLNDIRAVLGNDVAIKTYQGEHLPFPDGTIIARIAWSFDTSEENNNIFSRLAGRPVPPQSFVAGVPKNGVQFMVKDARKYAATGGWGYGQFDNGEPAGETVLKTCFPCHELMKARDSVFTRYAP